MNKIYQLLFLSFISVSLFGMEPAKRGIKRRASSDECQLASVMEIEHVPAASGFGILPSELKKKIFDYLITAPGITNEARMANAAENIRNCAAVNKDFRQYIKNYKTSGGTEVDVVGDLINGLAERYAPGNAAKAATIFGTADAGKWLAHYINDEVNDYLKNDKELETYGIFVDAVRDNKRNILQFLTAHLSFIKDDPMFSDALERGPRKLPFVEHAADSWWYIEQLPELHKTLYELLESRGATNEARLSNAAKNINDFALNNEEFYKWVAQKKVLDVIITELANRYANSNMIRAALILGVACNTIKISEWLHEYMQMNESQNLLNMLYAQIYHREAEEFDSIKKQRLIEQFEDAATKGDLNIIEFLLQHFPFFSNSIFWNAHNFPLIDAGQNSHLTVIERLLLIPNIKINIDNRDIHNATALMRAAENGSESMIKKLLENGANPNAHDMDNFAVLAYAAKKNRNAPIVKILITAGAHINHQDSGNNNTALHHAVLGKFPDVVKELLDAGASTDIQNDDHETALTYAVQNSSIEIIEKLLKAGADVNAKNRHGKTILQDAQELEDSPNKEAIIKLLRDAGAK